MRVVFAIALVFFATPAGAQDTYSANYRMEGCRAVMGDRPTYGSGYCLGMVDGLVFGEDRDPPRLCIPGPVTRVQMVRVVVAYIDARPARMHEDIRGLALEALLKAWPCKR
jgi:hypothetical protein